jgi:hypothetical protein
MRSQLAVSGINLAVSACPRTVPSLNFRRRFSSELKLDGSASAILSRSQIGRAREKPAPNYDNKHWKCEEKASHYLRKGHLCF